MNSFNPYLPVNHQDIDNLPLEGSCENCRLYLEEGENKICSDCLQGKAMISTKTLDKHLKEYKQLDLEYVALEKKRTVLKKKINDLMVKNTMDSYTNKQYKVSRYQTTRIIFLKEKLETLVDSQILAQCSKQAVSQGMRITYPKE